MKYFSTSEISTSWPEIRKPIMNDASTTLRKPSCSTMYDCKPNTLADSTRRSSNCATRSLGEPMNFRLISSGCRKASSAWSAEKWLPEW